MPLLSEEPPVLCDWLPWNHTFGGNHNIGIVYATDGTRSHRRRETAADGVPDDDRELQEIPVTAYFNVPRGYDLLVPCLRETRAAARAFLRTVEDAVLRAAALRQQVADDIQSMAGRRGGPADPARHGSGRHRGAPFAICA